MVTLRRTEQLRFTISSHGLVTYPAGATFGPRRLSDFEFVWIVEGNAVWQVDGKDVPAPAGTVILARPQMRDGFRWDPHHRTRHGFFHFSFNQGSATLPPLHTWPLSRNLQSDGVLRPLFHHLAWVLERQPTGWQELAQGAMRQALLAFLLDAEGQAGEAAPAEHTLVAAVHDHLREVWSDGELIPVTLGDMARAAGVSKVHLSRVFQAELGVAPVEAVRLLRLDRAASLLAGTNHSVTEIARICGFPNPFHFSRTFRACYRISPRAARERVRIGLSAPRHGLTRVRGFSSGLMP
ncbi:MAG: AraC family transcriptional regulator [Planctomycetota bacterium]